MSKTLALRPQADRDIDAIVRYLKAQASPAVAAAFLDEAERTLTLLSAQPGIGSMRHAAQFPESPAPLRFHPIKGFPRVLVYYFDLATQIDVIRIWDAARGLQALTDDTDTADR